MKGQVALFVILAIVIVALIILFFAIRGNIQIPYITSSIPNIQGDIESCTKNAVNNAIDIMLAQGGYIQPDLYKLYQGNKIAYLCYNQNYYAACINQQPLYIQHVSDEIEKFISGKIEDCFYKIEQDYREKNYNIDMSATKLRVGLAPKQVNVLIEKKIEISKNEEDKKIEKINVRISSPIYDLALIANEIANQEAKFCYFEYLGYSLTYPDFIIDKIDLNGETKIYTIKDKSSEEQMRIAIRSCAMPAGL